MFKWFWTIFSLGVPVVTRGKKSYQQNALGWLWESYEKISRISWERHLQTLSHTHCDMSITPHHCNLVRYYHTRSARKKAFLTLKKKHNITRIKETLIRLPDVYPPKVVENSDDFHHVPLIRIFSDCRQIHYRHHTIMLCKNYFGEIILSLSEIIWKSFYRQHKVTPSLTHAWPSSVDHAKVIKRLS